MGFGSSRQQCNRVEDMHFFNKGQPDICKLRLKPRIRRHGASRAYMPQKLSLMGHSTIRASSSCPTLRLPGRVYYSVIEVETYMPLSDCSFFAPMSGHFSTKMFG